MADPLERACVYFCVSETVTRRQREKRALLPWMLPLLAKLDAEVDLHEVLVSDSGHLVSDSRREFSCGVGELESRSLITAREAAGILGCSKRQVQRLAADLDGRIVDGRWLFDEKTVRDYAAAKKELSA